MKICPTHWQKLRDAIELRGLGHLISKRGEEAMGRMIDEVNAGSSDPANYDPLLNCNWMIMSKGLEGGGLGLLMPDEHGNPYCPICEAIKHGIGNETFWIDGPADVALDYCRHHKLVSRLQ